VKSEAHFQRNHVFGYISILEILLKSIFHSPLFKGKKVAETKPRNNHNRYLRGNFDSSEKNEDNVHRKPELPTLQQIPKRFPNQRFHRSSQR
jgi:hypothetical protein